MCVFVVLGVYREFFLQFIFNYNYYQAMLNAVFNIPISKIFPQFSVFAQVMTVRNSVNRYAVNANNNLICVRCIN